MHTHHITVHRAHPSLRSYFSFFGQFVRATIGAPFDEKSKVVKTRLTTVSLSLTVHSNCLIFPPRLCMLWSISKSCVLTHRYTKHVFVHWLSHSLRFRSIAKSPSSTFQATCSTSTVPMYDKRDLFSRMNQFSGLSRAPRVSMPQSIVVDRCPAIDVEFLQPLHRVRVDRQSGAYLAPHLSL